MPVLPILNANDHKLNKRLVTDDDGDVSIPRVFGIIFIVVALLVICYFGARNANRRRTRRLYNTRRNQGPVRVQRLEGYGGSGRNRGGERLPTWNESTTSQQVSPLLADESLNPPPPVYKRQNSVVVQRDPPPPYMGREGPS